MEDKLLVYTDGAARGNPGPAGIGWRIKDGQGKVLEEGAETIGPRTNNEAEYLAIIKALQRASRYSRGEVLLHSDSELVVCQLKGTYKVRKPHLLELYDKAKDEACRFRKVSYISVPRESLDIAAVDLLINKELDMKGY